MPPNPAMPSPHPPADAPATGGLDAPAAPGLIVCLAELLFLSALVVAERWLAREALGGTWFARSPLRYAGLIAAAAVAAYWALMALVPRADLEATLQRASLGLATPAAILVPYAWAGSPVWPLPALAAAGWFYLRECRGYLKSLRSDAGPVARVAPGVADELRSLGRDHGLSGMKLLVADERPAGAGKALAEYRPTTPEPTFVFTRAMLDLLSGPELRAVVAHELAHHRLKHSQKTLAAIFARRLLGAGVVCVVLEFSGLSASVWDAVLAGPSVLLTWYVTQVLLYPLHCAYLRRQERQAHRLALEMTGDPVAFVSALRKIAAHNGYGTGTSKLHTWLMGEWLPLDEALSLAGPIG